MINNKYFYFTIAVIGSIFIFVRLINILIFPIFNDEGLYIQYSQLISDDFGKYKYISMDNVFRDFKPPLQYWLGAIFIPFFQDPLLAVRILSVLFSIVGLAGVYLTASSLWNRRVGLIAIVVYTLMPPVLFYSLQFVTEVYVFSLAAILFFALIKVLEAPAHKINFGYTGLAIISSAALLLFKQSAMLYIYLFFTLPLFFWLTIRYKRDNFSGQQQNLAGENKHALRRNSVTLFFSLLIPLILYRFVFIPLRLFGTEALFTGRWIFHLTDIFKFPINIWWQNALNVYNFYVSYYTLGALALSIIFIFYAIYWRKNYKDMMVAFLLLSSSLIVILGLRGFNEYIYNTAVVVFLILALARLIDLVFIESPIESIKIKYSVMVMVFLLLIFITINWSHQIFLMKTSPVDYLLRSTEWAKWNYLFGWSNGFNVQDLVGLLKSQPEPSIAFIDPQWGNPGTALFIYRKYYPQVKVFPITADLFKPEIQQRIHQAGFKSKLVIFSKTGAAQDSRNLWQIPLEQTFCSVQNRQEIKKRNLQTPIVICQW